MWSYEIAMTHAHLMAVFYPRQELREVAAGEVLRSAEIKVADAVKELASVHKLQNKKEIRFVVLKRNKK